MISAPDVTCDHHRSAMSIEPSADYRGHGELMPGGPLTAGAAAADTLNESVGGAVRMASNVVGHEHPVQETWSPAGMR